MSEVQYRVTVRPDMDIREDITNIIVTYPPLAADRFRIDVGVVNGEVILKGHVSTPITRTYLIDYSALVDGVKAVDSRNFYDDESLRLASGKFISQGINVNVRSGTVVLSGTPTDGNIDEIAQSIAALPGVIRVVHTGKFSG